MLYVQDDDYTDFGGGRSTAKSATRGKPIPGPIACSGSQLVPPLRVEGEPEMKMLAVGDSYMPTRYFRQAFAALGPGHTIEYLQVDRAVPFTPSTASDLRIKEYQGSPAQICTYMADVEVLVVQGAPVTDAVLDASESLKLVGCARGGPVNVDVEAVSARGLPLVNTPGKNAEAVADQTLAFLVMLARGFPLANGSSKTVSC